MKEAKDKVKELNDKADNEVMRVEMATRDVEDAKRNEEEKRKISDDE